MQMEEHQKKRPLLVNQVTGELYLVWTQTLFALTLKDNSLKTAEILAATSTGAGEAKIKSSVGALFDFLPQAIKL